LMHPRKPDSGTTAELVALFRASKRTLAQDDIASLLSLYSSSTLGQFSEVEGSVTLGSSKYIGAHVVAYRFGSTDSDFAFYPESSPTTLILKGLDHVSAYSSDDGAFRIRGLKPGRYALITQNANSFLNFTYSSISEYLRIKGTQTSFPLQLFSNPDCADSPILNSNDASAEISSSLFELSATQALCNVDIRAHTGSTSTCGTAALVASSCGGGGGGCSLVEASVDATRDRPGLFLIAAGGGLIYFLGRRRHSKLKVALQKKMQRDQEPDLL